MRGATRGELQAAGAAVATAALIALAAPGTLTLLGAEAPSSRWPSLLAFVAFTPLLLRLRRQGPRAAVLTALATGWATNILLCLWFPGLLARFGDLHPALALVVTLGITAVHSLGWGAWAAVVVRTRDRLPQWLVAPATFVVFERWMPEVFPSSLGLTQYRWPVLVQAAELGGPVVLTFVMVLTSVAAADLIASRGRCRRSTAVAAAAVAAVVLFGLGRRAAVEAARAEAPTLRYGLIQPDPVKRGWSRPAQEPEASALARYQRASAELEVELDGELDLLLWPEKGYPLLLRRDARRDYPETHPRRIRRGFRAPLLFGLTAVDPSTRQITNSAALLGSDGRLEVVYDKVRLILFSEWLPSWAAGWFGGGLRYLAGERFEPVMIEVDGEPVPVALLICFESTFPGHVRALMEREPRLLINLVDDGWFGPTAEPEQHLSQAVFRAVEARRDLIRATASGVSAHLSATGEILARRELNRGADGDRLVGEAALLSLASLSGRLGDLFSWLCAAVALTGLLWRRRKGPGR